jgi:hypothetical protein
MKNTKPSLKILFIFGLFSLTSPAYAYLDPGTGSMLIQGLVGGIAVVTSFISIYWHKVKAFFVKEEDMPKEDKDQPFIDKKNLK